MQQADHELRFTFDDLCHNFRNGKDCPIYRALKRSGAPVATVAGDFWLDNYGLVHWFNPGLQQASSRLAASDKGRWRRLFTLWGKKISYSINDGEFVNQFLHGGEALVLRR